jgi:Dyp-type peroxidase family
MQIDLTTLVREDGPNRAEAFSDVQGNILKGHGRTYARFIFLTFVAGAENGVKTWIASLVKDNLIVSATRQLRETDLYHAHGIPGGLFGAFFLSSAGYRYLGFTDGQLEDPGFQEGMQQAGGRLNDPPPTKWEKGFRGTVHALLLLADDRLERLDAAVLAALSAVQPLTVPGGIHVELGNVLNNEHGDGIEHFGYADGVSQPVFIAEDLNRMVEKGLENPQLWNPEAPLDLVLVRDPYGRKENSFGSYFVFRKLEQNVKGFKTMEAELAGQLGLTGEAEERAGALLIGRFEDGTPVTLQGAEGMHHPIVNGFNYAYDPSGNKCPFHAHIRKVNPRGDSGNLDKERSHRVARRGIPYGTRTPDFSDQPIKDVGLLFMCYQRSIGDQFEFMQRNWANDQDPAVPGQGTDPIIGQGDRHPQAYSFEWGEAEKCPFAFAPFVTLKGGEYFFAPSLSFLENLIDSPVNATQV